MDPTSFRLFSGAAGATESEYFSFRHPVSDISAPTVDSSGNIYVAYHTYGGSTDIDVVKYNKQGSVLWARRLSQAVANSLYFDSCVLDSSGNFYLSGGVYRSSRNFMVVVKFNSSGTLQWARELGNATGNEVIPGERNAIDVDSSGNVYVGGYIRDPSTFLSKAFYAKWNSSGTLQAQESFGVSSILSGTQNKINSVDASGSFPVFVGINDVSGSPRAYIIQFSSGSGATAKTINTTYDSNFSDVKVNGTSIYCSFGKGSLDSRFSFFEFNSSLSIVRQRVLGTSATGNIKSIDIDSSGNIYATGASNEGNVEGRYDCLIAKWNSSGTIQWSRYFGRKNLDIDETGFKIFHDNTNSNLWMFNADAVGGTNVPTTGNNTPSLYFPDDGSLTGDITHSVTYKYQATNLSESAGSFTTSTATASRTTESFSEGSWGGTSSTISFSGLTVVSQP